MNEGKIIAHSIDTVTRTKDVIIEDDVNFQAMFLSDRVFEGLTKSGFQRPSPIQLKAIPLGRCGFDLIIKSKSGTGKTIVFTVIILEMIDPTISDLQALILAPTREIAVQISDVIQNVGKFITGLKVESFIGGLPEKDDVDRANNCHIAVGAPGRVKSLIKQNILKIDSLKLFVIDEADKLLEKDFIGDIIEIYNKLPEKKQMIATSATFSDKLKEFLGNFMLSPTYIDAELETPLLLGLKHFIKEVRHSSNVVQEMKYKNEDIMDLLSKIPFVQCLIFTNYQTRAESISLTLNRNGWKSIFISAAQSQTKRLEVMEELKQFKCRILLSTDLTARGIDAANIDLIINYDIPRDVMTYLHRMGRAGRYGSKGICVSLVSGSKDMKQIQKFLGQIGGTKLTIPKIPGKLSTNLDLWECDQSEFEQIAGVIEDGNGKSDESVAIKDEVFKLKNVERKMKSDKNPVRKIIDEIPDNYRVDNIQINANTMKQMESLLKEDSHVEKMDIGESENILSAMANRTFDFDKLIDKNSTVHDNSDSIQNKNESITLRSLANGQFDFNMSESDTNQSHSPATFMKNIQIDKELHEPSDLLKSLANGEFNFEKSESDTNRSNSAVIFADNELTGRSNEHENRNKIFTRNKGLYEIATIVSKHPQTVNKNTEDNLIEYLNVLGEDIPHYKEENKILENQVQNNECSKTVTSQEKIENPKNTENESCTRDSLDKLFVHAYRFAITGEDHWKNYVPKEDLKIEKKEMQCEVTECVTENSDDCEDELMEDFNEDENYEDCPGIEYDENGKRIYAYEDIPNRMVWVPVEESVLNRDKSCAQINLLENNVEAVEIPISNQTLEVQKSYQPDFNSNAESSYMCDMVESQAMNPNLRDYNYDHFTDCFRYYSDELWQNGWRFNSVESFDNWFYRWQQQVKHVSDYVRQNIYVREMSSYQNSYRN